MEKRKSFVVPNGKEALRSIPCTERERKRKTKKEKEKEEEERKEGRKEGRKYSNASK
jgi:hypothetical protein